jgi:hypothetical protein
VLRAVVVQLEGCTGKLDSVSVVNMRAPAVRGCGTEMHVVLEWCTSFGKK